MRNRIHPQYRPVVFRDRGADYAFLTRSTAETDRTIEWRDGRTYPLVDVDVSSASHPFYTGRRQVLDATGAVEKFNRRYRRS
ncbi:type B 50S ribosomal protein L31 [Actinomadura napierensis]|uniref:Large ribosomal subunit protein bL31B n=1 Tax=Actinomadura napierensis TaxID=267854 RepID=A0ABN3AD14_9ACTN